MNPYARCLNCKEVYCKLHKYPEERCPDRPLYGPKDNGHYLRFEMQKKPILLMPRAPAKATSKAKSCTHADCEICI